MAWVFLWILTPDQRWVSERRGKEGSFCFIVSLSFFFFLMENDFFLNVFVSRLMLWHNLNLLFYRAIQIQRSLLMKVP